MSRASQLRLMLVMIVSLSLFSCKSKSKEEKPSTTDTTVKTTEPTPTTTDNSAMDAVKVAPELYKVLTDSLGIRMVEATYKPGDSSAMHYHPDYAIYVAQGGNVT